jgi:hypothetical protein
VRVLHLHQQIQAVFLGENQIQQDDVKGLLVEQAHPVEPARRGAHTVTMGMKIRRQHLANRRFIINDKYVLVAILQIDSSLYGVSSFGHKSKPEKSFLPRGDKPLAHCCPSPLHSRYHRMVMGWTHRGNFESKFKPQFLKTTLISLLGSRTPTLCCQTLMSPEPLDESSDDAPLSPEEMARRWTFFNVESPPGRLKAALDLLCLDSGNDYRRRVHLELIRIIGDPKVNIPNRLSALTTLWMTMSWSVGVWDSEAVDRLRVCFDREFSDAEIDRISHVEKKRGLRLMTRQKLDLLRIFISILITFGRETDISRIEVLQIKHKDDVVGAMIRDSQGRAQRMLAKHWLPRAT